MAKITDYDRMIAENYRKMGFPNIARYVEKYGDDEQDEGFTGPTRMWDEFYAKCLKEGHTWDYYHKYPKDARF